MMLTTMTLPHLAHLRNSKGSYCIGYVVSDGNSARREGNWKRVLGETEVGLQGRNTTLLTFSDHAFLTCLHTPGRLRHGLF